jgi:hypothetical protein
MNQNDVSALVTGLLMDPQMVENIAFLNDVSVIGN